jgi:hypothetical protein
MATDSVGLRKQNIGLTLSLWPGVFVTRRVSDEVRVLSSLMRRVTFARRFGKGIGDSYSANCLRPWMPRS